MRRFPSRPADLDSAGRGGNPEDLNRTVLRPESSAGLDFTRWPKLIAEFEPEHGADTVRVAGGPPQTHAETGRAAGIVE